MIYTRANDKLSYVYVLFCFLASLPPYSSPIFLIYKPHYIKNSPVNGTINCRQNLGIPTEFRLQSTGPPYGRAFFSKYLFGAFHTL